MWGCIGYLRRAGDEIHVPSLYVRVYRPRTCPEETLLSSLIICEGVSCKKNGQNASARSLIICEGVSQAKKERKRLARFPHYMWGCIVISLKFPFHVLVPSLYVRVYRHEAAAVIWMRRSLIICEGVSTQLTKLKEFQSFPHYMWGCIALTYHTRNI